MRIDHLRYLLSVAEKKNLTAAARAHFISQSALSQQLARIERTLDVQLFVRDKNEWQPTPAGQLMLKAAEEIVKIHSDLLKNLEQIAHRDKNTIILGMSSERSSLLLPRTLQIFKMEFPDFKIQLKEGHLPALQQMVLDRRVDLAFTVAPEVQDSSHPFRFHPVYEEELALVVHPGHRFVKKGLKQVNLSELSGESFVHHNKEKIIRHVLDGVFQDIGCHPKETMEVNSTRSAIEFAANGIGVTIVPKMFTLSYPSIRIIPTKPQLKWELGMLYQGDRDLSSPEKRIIESFSKTVEEKLA